MATNRHAFLVHCLIIMLLLAVSFLGKDIQSRTESERKNTDNTPPECICKAGTVFLSTDMSLALVVHISAGRITEAWDMFSDQYAWDEFWS